MRRPLIALAGLAVIAAVVVGLSQTSGNGTRPRPSRLTLAEMQQRLAGAPAPLAALHRQGSRLVGGGTAAVRARLAGLRGYPVVLNKWASWCGPCRVEFPFFQRLGVEYGRRVAFLALDSGDNHADARSFLRRFPVTYPSYEDPNHRTATALGIPPTFPVTVFYDSTGRRQFIHQGRYLSQARLREDIERYGLRSGS